MHSAPASIDLRGRRVTLMGLGRFGGGVGAARFLAERGARVTVTDLSDEQALRESLAQLDGVTVEALHLGGHHEQDFIDADLVVANPAVPRSDRFLELARTAGIPVTSEIALFWMHNHGRVIGVTGSNGKSTTAALCHAMLQAAGLRSWLGGNIGGSLLPVVELIRPDDWVVLELSSFQLHDLDALYSSPEIGVVTNFSPNHLDWHRDLDDYRRAKQTILRWQHDQHTAILNAGDRDVSQWTSNGRRVYFGANDHGQSGVVCSEDRLLLRNGKGESTVCCPPLRSLPGRHNSENLAAAACAAWTAGADAAAIAQAAEQFTPLPHRLQFVAEVAGRSFYNDSLATTPESAQRALESFDAPIVLLAGGYDKQVDLTPLAAEIAARTKAVALMGQTADALAYLIEEESFSSACSKRVCASLEEAFGWAVEQSAPGDVVLLSPGCASYDWFANFAERGERFVELVNDWGRQQR